MRDRESGAGAAAAAQPARAGAGSRRRRSSARSRRSARISRSTPRPAPSMPRLFATPRARCWPRARMSAGTMPSTNWSAIACAKGVDMGAGFALLTARCSYELVEKAALAGIPLLVTISAPTSLAVERAKEAGLTLVALARSDSVLVMSDPHGAVRLAPSPSRGGALVQLQPRPDDRVDAADQHQGQALQPAVHRDQVHPVERRIDEAGRAGPRSPCARRSGCPSGCRPSKSGSSETSEPWSLIDEGPAAAGPPSAGRDWRTRPRPSGAPPARAAAPAARRRAGRRSSSRRSRRCARRGWSAASPRRRAGCCG